MAAFAIAVVFRKRYGGRMLARSSKTEPAAVIANVRHQFLFSRYLNLACVRSSVYSASAINFVSSRVSFILAARGAVR